MTPRPHLPVQIQTQVVPMLFGSRLLLILLWEGKKKKGKKKKRKRYYLCNHSLVPFLKHHNEYWPQLPSSCLYFEQKKSNPSNGSYLSTPLWSRISGLQFQRSRLWHPGAKLQAIIGEILSRRICSSHPTHTFRIHIVSHSFSAFLLNFKFIGYLAKYFSSSTWFQDKN